MVTDNRGSSVVELCLIFPIVVWTIFFVIFLFVGELNHGIAEGEAYEKLYNRGAYIFSNTGQAAFENILEEHIEKNLENGMSFLEALDVSVNFISSGDSLVHNLKKFRAGDLEIIISYEAMYPGISKLVEASFVDKTITCNQEIRDTGNNLRRWQLYGQILSN